MKKILLLAWLFSIPLLSPAQPDTIPNAGFETWWFSGWGVNPAFWATNNSQIMAANVIPDSSSHSGTTALMLINSGNFRPHASTGFPLLHHPLVLNGFFKNQLHMNDSALIHIRVFSNGNLTDSGFALVTGGITISGYYPLSIPVSQNVATADSCEIVLEGGNTYLSQISFDDLSLTFSTGIGELPAPVSFEVYPNPFSDWLQVTSNADAAGEVRIRLSDVLGRVITERTSIYKEETRFELTNLPAGIYMLSLEKGNNRATRKIIKYEGR